MLSSFRLKLCSSLCFVCVTCGLAIPDAHAQQGETPPGVIPFPAVYQERPGAAAIGDLLQIYYPAQDSAAAWIAERMAGRIQRLTGAEFGISQYEKRDQLPADGIVVRRSERERAQSEESYAIDISPQQIQLGAEHDAGLLYAANTLTQLIYQAHAGGEDSLASTAIRDTPRFAWRGMLIDVARHFFDIDFLKRYIDVLADYKINTLQLHLTDSQGWRIEIDAYPKLTAVGAWRPERAGIPWQSSPPMQDGELASYGGYYTKAELRDLIAYAGKRNVQIIPEIDLPGHSAAALVAYPELACEGEPPPMPTGAVSAYDHAVCPGRSENFAIIKGILSEVADVFPADYIHIGGDEVDKTRWLECANCKALMKKENLRDGAALQSWFVRQVSDILSDLDRKLIGWDEIMQGGLAPGATVMAWRGMQYGRAAAARGHDVIMAPTTHTYFDLYQADPSLEPPAYGMLPLRKAYEFNPIAPYTPASTAEHILGGQACLWTERIDTESHAWYMTLPRLLAFTESVWSPAYKRDWQRFAGALRLHESMLELQGIAGSRSASRVTFDISFFEDDEAQVRLQTEIPESDVRYHINSGRNGGDVYLKYDSLLTLSKTATISAAVFREDTIYSEPSSKTVYFSRFASNASLKMISKVSASYAGAGSETLRDRQFASFNYRDKRWQGFEGKDLEVQFSRNATSTVSFVAANFLQNPHQWIFLPREVLFEASNDGKKFREIARISIGKDAEYSPAGIYFFGAPVDTRAKHIRVSATSLRRCPKWHKGAGRKAWLFADEIIIE